MAEVGVLGTVHFSHGTLADFYNGFVVADGDADQCPPLSPDDT